MSSFTRFVGSTCFATAAALLVAAAPAQATSTNTNPEPAAAPTPQATEAAPSVDAKRYCMKDSTNSRITKKICKTKSEWARVGVDIDS